MVFGTNDTQSAQYRFRQMPLTVTSYVVGLAVALTDTGATYLTGPVVKTWKSAGATPVTASLKFTAYVTLDALSYWVART